ncbi:MAG TPA: hypothetical protein DEA44_05270 [Firmicutes bacterium]|nr:hypothetical protein [Bacillota bacterium]
MVAWTRVQANFFCCETGIRYLGDRNAPDRVLAKFVEIFITNGCFGDGFLQRSTGVNLRGRLGSVLGGRRRGAVRNSGHTSFS